MFSSTLVSWFVILFVRRITLKLYTQPISIKKIGGKAAHGHGNNNNNNNNNNNETDFYSAVVS